MKMYSSQAATTLVHTGVAAATLRSRRVEAVGDPASDHHLGFVLGDRCRSIELFDVVAIGQGLAGTAIAHFKLRVSRRWYEAANRRAPIDHHQDSLRSAARRLPQLA